MEPQETTTPVQKPLDENTFPQASQAGGSSSILPLLLAIVGLVVLAIAAWYFMRPSAMPGDMMPVPDLPPPTAETGTMPADPVVQALSTQGTSDEIADIEADLNATDLNVVEADLQAI